MKCNIKIELDGTTPTQLANIISTTIADSDIVKKIDIGDTIEHTGPSIKIYPNVISYQLPDRYTTIHELIESDLEYIYDDSIKNFIMDKVRFNMGVGLAVNGERLYRRYIEYCEKNNLRIEVIKYFFDNIIKIIYKNDIVPDSTYPLEDILFSGMAILKDKEENENEKV